MLQWLKNNQAIAVAVCIGVLVGILGFIFPLNKVLIGACAIVVMICVLWKVEIGIFLVVALVPFLTTMQSIGLVVLCILSFIIQLFLSKGSFNLKTNPLSFPAILFMLMILYSSITSFSPGSSIFIALVYISFVLFFMVIVNTVKTKKQFKRLVILFVFSGFIVSLYGIYQYYLGDPTTQSWIDKEMFQDIKARVYSTFDNPNVLGEYLVMLIPISLALLWTQKNGLFRIILGAVTVAMGICLIYTSSRGSWLGIMLALAIFCVLRDKRLIVAGVGAIFLLPFMLPQSIIQRFSSIGNLEDTSSAYRLSIWLGSLKVIRDYWPAGIGLGSDAFIKIYPRYALSGAAFALHAHNIYLQLLVEMGVFGFISFLLIILLFYKSMLSAFWRTEDKFLSTMIIALCSGVTGYLFQGLVDNIWYNYRVMFVFWIVISFGMVAHRLVSQGNYVAEDDN